MDRIDITSLSDERRREILTSNQDTRTIEVGGEDFLFYLGGGSFDIAREHGIDLEELLNEGVDPEGLDPAKVRSMSEEELQEYAEQQELGLEATMDQLAYLLFVGCVPFDADLTPAEMKLRVTLQDIPRLSQEIMPQVQEMGSQKVPPSDTVGKETDREPPHRAAAPA
jgi:hypothetical protein